MFTDFLRGVSYVPRAFRLLTAPRLRGYVWLPILVNVAVFGGVLVLGADYLAGWLGGLLPAPGSVGGEAWWRQVLAFLLAVLQWLLLPIALLGAVIVMFYTFTAVANVIASPFNGMLAARVEEWRTGAMPPDVDPGSGPLVDAGRAVADELRKIAYFIALGIPLLLLFLVPVINLVAAPVWMIFGAWVMALEYSDYTLGNHGLSFREQRVVVRRRRALHFGLGGGLLAMTVIPGLNLLAMPTGVIAAALLHSDLQRDRAGGEPAT